MENSESELSKLIDLAMNKLQANSTKEVEKTSQNFALKIQHASGAECDVDGSEVKVDSEGLGVEDLGHRELFFVHGAKGGGRQPGDHGPPLPRLTSGVSHVGAQPFQPPYPYGRRSQYHHGDAYSSFSQGHGNGAPFYSRFPPPFPYYDGSGWSSQQFGRFPSPIAASNNWPSQRQYRSPNQKKPTRGGALNMQRLQDSLPCSRCLGNGHQDEECAYVHLECLECKKMGHKAIACRFFKKFAHSQGGLPS
ncbi:hypothetical protein GE061_012260 [Apolygus lucorum]|uniref:CCHC-type domain-containing protein n=1 Tax=Apolygus lucorum TaxID=248454 RepID=A0A8S9XVW2_APOLU|nr:hypothetical protein GE061_012260 [Apolygus lucorum]